MVKFVNPVGDKAIAGRRRLAEGTHHTGITKVALRRAIGRAAEMLAQHHGGHGFEHRRLDIAALAGGALTIEAGQHRLTQGQPGDLVRSHHRHKGRGTGVASIGLCQSRASLDQVVKSWQVGIGSALPEPDRRTIDDARIDFAYGVITKTQPLNRGDPHVVDNKVRLTQHFQQDRAPFAGLEVEGDAAFVAVHRHPLGGHARFARDPEPPVVVAIRGLYLDDIRTEVTQELGRIGREKNMAQFHDTHAVEHIEHDISPNIFAAIGATKTNSIVYQILHT